MTDVVQLSARYLKAWQERDPDAIVSLHTENTRFWSHLGGAPVEGRAAVRAAFVEVFEQLPGFSFEVHRQIFGQNHWVLDWTLVSGTVRFDCLDVVVVSADGLVERKDTFVDAVQMQAALSGGNTVGPVAEAAG